jgi:hypothetical protein
LKRAQCKVLKGVGNDQFDGGGADALRPTRPSNYNAQLSGGFLDCEQANSTHARSFALRDDSPP